MVNATVWVFALRPCVTVWVSALRPSDKGREKHVTFHGERLTLSLTLIIVVLYPYKIMWRWDQNSWNYAISGAKAMNCRMLPSCRKVDFVVGHKHASSTLCQCIVSTFVSSDNILIWISEVSRRMRWAWHVLRMGEKRNAYRILVWKPEGRRPLGRPWRR
jgi:hypothetical protein